MLRSAAHFPNALVRFLPLAFEMAEDGDLQLPARLLGREAALAGLMHGVQQLAIDIYLNLTMCAVTDAHGRRVFVTGKPGKLDFVEPPFSGDAIHDLHLIGAAGDRAQQPFAPVAGLLEVAGVHQGEEGERCVPQPAIAIVPVALSAEVLRQRSCHRRHQAASGRIGHRFQRDERAPHRVGIRARHIAGVGPIFPEFLGLAEQVLPVGLWRVRYEGCIVSQRE